MGFGAFQAWEQNYFVVGSVNPGPNRSQANLMFQVTWIVKFEVLREENTQTNYFELLAVQMSAVKQAVELVVKKPLRCVQKAGDYLRLIG